MSGPSSTGQVGPTPRFWIKTVCLLVSVFLFFFLIVPQSYKAIRKWRYLQVAETAFENKKYDQALYFAYIVHQEDLRNTKAVSLISRTYLLLHHPSSLRWLSYAAELDPGNPRVQLNLGKVALTRNNLSLARKCLERAQALKDAPQEELLELQTLLLIKQGKDSEARKLLSRNSGRNNGTYTDLDIHYAVLLLKGHEQDQKQGILLLSQISHHPPLRARALEQLLRYSLERQDQKLAFESSSLLLEEKKLSIQQYLLTAQVRLFFNKQLPEQFNTEIVDRLKAHPKELVPVVEWLLKNSQPEATDHLLNHFLTTKEQLPVIRPLHVSRLAEKGRWQLILDTLQDPEWKDMGSLRYMFLLQACRELKDQGLAGMEAGFYRGLALEIQRNPYTIFIVDRMASNWGWDRDRIRLWELLENTDKWPDHHLKASLEHARQGNNTVQLYGLGRLLEKRFPDNPAIRNNVITMTLLLDLRLPEQLEAARRLVEKYPGSKILKTTYALALLKNGQPAEAVAQYADFSETELQNPEVAAYYAMALMANRQAEKAAPYLSLSRKASLLPEEKALLKQ